MSRVLHAHGVDFAYERGRFVLRDVAVTFKPGVMSGIVGPNGSGKSTLLRILCGLLRPQRGHVVLDDKPLDRYGSRERARSIAFLPQSVNPAFDLTVTEVVALGRYPHLGTLGTLTPADLDVTRRCLTDTHTDHLGKRNFLSLSGGERQRVLVASILAQEPAVLLLDEPTSALDIHHQAEVFALLAVLAGRGYGVGVVTHDLNMAAQFCDRVYLLAADGRILCEGLPEEVFTEPMLSAAYDAPIRVTRHPLNDSLLVAAGTPSRPDP